MKEVWKDVVGYEGLYQVSNLGKIRSLRRKNAILLKENNKSDGYSRVSLCVNYNSKKYLVHRLVAKAFIPNPNFKKFINHKNGIKKDNREENLEWCTHQENITHAFKLGLIPIRLGECHNVTKLKKQDVTDIRKLRKFLTQKELSIIFDTSISNIKNIEHRRTWKHI